MVLQDSEFLEKIWLLRAELMNVTLRSENASHMIFRATEFNRSGYVVNMFEGLFFAAQNYSKSAESFKKAFEATGCRDFTSGERCAWACIKANRPMEALNILENFRGPGTSLPSSAYEINAEMWSVLLGLRHQILRALAFKADEEESRNRSRKASKAP